MPNREITHWAKPGTYYRRNSYLGGVVQRRQKKVTASRFKLAQPVRKLVDRRIALQTETQHAAYHLRRNQFANLITADPANRIYSVIPPIATGTLRDDRHGATLKCKSLFIRGRIDIPADDNPPIGNDDRAQIYVRMFVLSVKRDQLLTEVITDWPTFYDPVFFKDNAQPTAPTGRYVDMLSAVNRELFTVHSDKVMKLDRNYGYFPDPTSTSGAAAQRPVSKEFRITMKVKNKMLKYNTPSTVLPSNFQPFVVCLFAYGNGAAPSSSKVPFIEYQSKMSFKS
jgi:hypothetical protein